MCMLLSNQNMPDLQRFERAGDKVQALYEYVYMMHQEINHVLSNLDEGNLGKSLKQTLSGLQSAKEQQTQDVQAGTGQEAAPEPEETEPALTLLDVYPIGSIYVSAENRNPASKLGGKWELVDKLLKAASYNQNTNAITINTNNVDSIGTCVITVDGNIMDIYVSLTTKVALADQSVNLFALNLEAIGVSSLAAKRIVGNSDGGNGFVNAAVDSDGNVLATDVVTKTSGANMAANVGVQFSATWKINKNSRMDAFCDRFFWKRTA